MDLELTLIVCVGALMAAFFMLVLNRQELLKVIKQKEETLDSTTRAIAKAEEENNRYLVECQELALKLNSTILELESEKEKNQVVLSQKKSSETKLGAIAENALPLLQNVPYNPQNLRHLAMPIDFVYFDYDSADPGVIFIEVKSGKAKESSRQKLIKKFILEGKVYYEELRINENGVKIKRAKMDNSRN